MSEELRNLQTKLAELESKMAELKTIKFKAEKEYKDVLDESLNVRKYIDELNKVANVYIRVTDHAVVRYIERFCDVNTKAIREDIIKHINLDDLKKLGGDCIIKTDRMRIVIEGYTVITVTELK